MLSEQVKMIVALCVSIESPSENSISVKPCSFRSLISWINFFRIHKKRPLFQTTICGLLEHIQADFASLSILFAFEFFVCEYTHKFVKLNLLHFIGFFNNR